MQVLGQQEDGARSRHRAATTAYARPPLGCGPGRSPAPRGRCPRHRTDARGQRAAPQSRDPAAASASRLRARPMSSVASPQTASELPAPTGCRRAQAWPTSPAPTYTVIQALLPCTTPARCSHDLLDRVRCTEPGRCVRPGRPSATHANRSQRREEQAASTRRRILRARGSCSPPGAIRTRPSPRSPVARRSPSTRSTRASAASRSCCSPCTTWCTSADEPGRAAGLRRGDAGGDRSDGAKLATYAEAMERLLAATVPGRSWTRGADRWAYRTGEASHLAARKARLRRRVLRSRTR